MKTIVSIALTLFVLQATAQDRHEDRTAKRQERAAQIAEISAEDMAQIRTKKMTLHLDLSEAQQKKIQALHLEQAMARKAKLTARAEAKAKQESKKPSPEARVKMMNERLDAQIAFKKEMKNILNAEQFEKWEKTQEKRYRATKSKRHKMKGKRPHHGDSDRD